MERYNRHASPSFIKIRVAKKQSFHKLPGDPIGVAARGLAMVTLIENKPYSKMVHENHSIFTHCQETPMRLRKSITVIGLIAALGLAGCSAVTEGSTKQTTEIFSTSYGKSFDAGYALPAIPIKKIDKRFHRQTVKYQTSERRGTIIVDTKARYLYYVLGNGMAMRYGIGVGKQGFSWKGQAYVAWKQEWPTWHPPQEMAERKPEVARYVEKGMEPGLKNPLGARALYLFNDKGQDTLFRLHGTPEWNSIGTAASSGCIRMINQDIIDLYGRVTPGKNARVIVL